MKSYSIPRYLTKSRFKLGLECPTKLYYTGKSQYTNQGLEDSFLEALAQGGYQVGALAKYYFPGGHDIRTLDPAAALEETTELLRRDKVIIYEAAIRYRNLFVRVDILVKDGNRLDLVEVKAKAFIPDEVRFLRKDGKGLLKEWAPYIHDVAFENYVLQQAFPDATINAQLMMMNRIVAAHTEGLNTKFRITGNASGNTAINVVPTFSGTDVTPGLLATVNVAPELAYVYGEEPFAHGDFASEVQYLADLYQADEREQGPLGTVCGRCEFDCDPELAQEGQLSGFRECWKTTLGWKDADFAEPMVLDVWGLASRDRLMQAGKYKLTDLEEGDFPVRSSAQPGLSTSERQWLQVQKAQQRDHTPYIDRDGLRAEMAQWRYPLHFIDFETSSVALPFSAGRVPYEGIAFQFSHHVMHEDGSVEHAGEFLDTRVGHFPNFDFIRALMRELGGDNGTVFRYSSHENTVLNTIYRQLLFAPGMASSEVDKLATFIRSISQSTQSSPEPWIGERNMVDLWDLVKRYYYHPATAGSTSLKYVLPAMLSSSEYLQTRYSRPIYGSVDGIRSNNFRDWVWVKLDESGSGVIDPYELLPPMFEDAPGTLDELLSANTDIANGGEALTAYAKMQFTDMTDYERGELRAALLKYCELDTLAMVMIVEGWQAELRA